MQSRQVAVSFSLSQNAREPAGSGEPQIEHCEFSERTISSTAAIIAQVYAASQAKPRRCPTVLSGMLGGGERTAGATESAGQVKR